MLANIKAFFVSPIGSTKRNLRQQTVNDTSTFYPRPIRVDQVQERIVLRLERWPMESQTENADMLRKASGERRKGDLEKH